MIFGSPEPDCVAHAPAIVCISIWNSMYSIRNKCGLFLCLLIDWNSNFFFFRSVLRFCFAYVLLQVESASKNKLAGKKKKKTNKTTKWNIVAGRKTNKEQNWIGLNFSANFIYLDCHFSHPLICNYGLTRHTYSNNFILFFFIFVFLWDAKCRNDFGL